MSIEINQYQKHDIDVHHIASKDEPDVNVMVAKATAMSVLFLASMTMGLLPIKLSKLFKWSQVSDVKSHTFVSLLLAFGGGVLLCTTFQHLLPEVNESIEELQKDEVIPEFQFHLGEFLMCAGFFLIFLVEELVHLYLHRREKRHELEHVFERSLSLRRSDKPVLESGLPQTITPNDLLSKNNDTKKPLEEAKHDHSGHGHSHTIILPIDTSDDPIVTNLRGLLVVLALSVHELFEGLAVGLEKSTSNVWYMFGAVAAHKLVIAFCVGVELVASKTRMGLTVIYVFVFAVVSPMGIGLGMGLSAADSDDESDTTTEIVSVIMQGIATGTLLYVVFFEVMQRDRQGLKQYLAIVLGFLVMFGLQFLSDA